MISAASGSYAASLISLFSRQQGQSDDTKDATRTAQRPPPPPPPLGSDGSTQSVLASLLQALAGQDQSTTGTTTVAAQGTSSSQDLTSALAGLLDAMDTNQDGTLSSTEISSALGALSQGKGAFNAPPPPPPPSDSDSGSGDVFGLVVKSLYQSLFEAMTAGDSTTASADSTTTAAQKVSDTLTTAT